MTMKNSIYIIGLLLVMLTACELEPQVQISENPVPQDILVPAEGQAYRFTAANENDSVRIIVSPVDLGFPVMVRYTAYVDKDGGDFERAKNLGMFTGDTLTISVKKFNTEINKLKLPIGEVANLDLKISCFISTTLDLIESDITSITYVPY